MFRMRAEILNDTTYSGPAFTNLDYAQFSNNGKCIIAADHIYYPAEKGFPKVPKDSLITATYDYVAIGPGFIIKNPQTIPILNNGLTADTVTIANPNTLLIHSVFYPVTMSTIAVPPQRTISDAYYTR